MGSGRVFCQMRKATPAATNRANIQRISLLIPTLLLVDLVDMNLKLSYGFLLVFVGITSVYFSA
jgi:hypothetical protein